MNICLSGLNAEKVKEFSKCVAQKFNYKFIDAEEEFKPFLLRSAKYATLLVDEILKETETKLLKQLTKQQNSVVAIPADMLLANNNAKVLKNSIVVAVLEEDLQDLQKDVQTLLISKCKFNVVSKQELVSILNDKLM